MNSRLFAARPLKYFVCRSIPREFAIGHPGAMQRAVRG